MRIRSPTAFIGGCIAACGLNAQLLDPIRNYCTRFDHQCKWVYHGRCPRSWRVAAVKNDMLYIYMGTGTFVDVQNNGAANGTVTIGYSTLHVQIPFTGAIELTDAR